jgi:hypothetical protein
MMVISDTIAAHILSVYDYMNENAEKQGEHTVFTGSLVGVVSELGISRTYYAPIYRALYDGGYCDLLDRGGRAKPSSMLLVHRPTVAELKGLTLEDESPIVSTTRRLEAIEKNIGGLTIAQAFRAVEKRLADLEQKVEAMGGK